MYIYYADVHDKQKKNIENASKDCNIEAYWIVENGSLQLINCPTDDMVADTLKT